MKFSFVRGTHPVVIIILIFLVLVVGYVGYTRHYLVWRNVVHAPPHGIFYIYEEPKDLVDAYRAGDDERIGGERGVLYKLFSDGKKEILLEGVSLQAQNVKFSPDRTKILAGTAGADYDLALYDFTKGTKQPSGYFSFETGQYPASYAPGDFSFIDSDWSLDGKYLYASGPGGSLYKMYVGEENITDIEAVARSFGNDRIIRPRVSPNDDMIAFVRLKQGVYPLESSLFVVPTDNYNAARLVTSRLGGSEYVWSQDGIFLFFVDGVQGLTKYDAISGQEQSRPCAEAALACAWMVSPYSDIKVGNENVLYVWVLKADIGASGRGTVLYRYDFTTNEIESVVESERTGYGIPLLLSSDKNWVIYASNRTSVYSDINGTSIYAYNMKAKNLYTDEEISVFEGWRSDVLLWE